MSERSAATELFPAAAVAPLLAWYAVHARELPWRTRPTPYRVWISEIMLQQTRVEAVKPFFQRFLTALPTLDALADAPEEQLLKLWEGLGYYRRVRNLQAAARKIREEFGGVFPAERRDLLTLPGVGDYTAGAIASIAFGRPEPAVDGNVMRVAARLSGCRNDIDDPRFRKRLAAELTGRYPAGHCSEFTQSLMELGATVCLPNGAPLCAVCPLAALCRARRDDTVAELPVRTPKKSRRIELRTIFLLHCAGRTALRRRPPRGVLAGMWELPSLDGHRSAAEVIAHLAERRIAVTAIRPGPTVRHIFTHLEWRMISFCLECPGATGDFRWAAPRELAEELSLPSAFRPFFRNADSRPT